MAVQPLPGPGQVIHGAPPLAQAWPLASLTFSPDGKLLAVALTDGTVQLWSLESGAELLRWPANTAPAAIAHLAFTPDGKGLAGCDARQHYLWRLDLPDLHRRLAEIGLEW
jgi:WD40 repeat protein